MQKRKILILSFTFIETDPRVQKQIHSLKNRYSLTVCGKAEEGYSLDDIDIYPLVSRQVPFLRKALRFLGMMIGFSHSYQRIDRQWSDTLNELKKRGFDLVLVNDVFPLPAGLSIARGNPCLFDAHEYYPDSGSNQTFKQKVLHKYQNRILRKYIKKVTSISTVCDGISDLYKRDFNINPIVLENFPPSAGIDNIRRTGEQVRLIHHGRINISRQIENMIYLMDLLDYRFTLDLMLVNRNKKLYQAIERLTTNRANVNIVEPVPMPEISAKLHQDYDIGIYILPPSNINQKYALPNKFFEFIQAGLAICIGPSIEMAKIVERDQLGIVADSFDIHVVAEFLKRLNPTGIDTYKFNSLAVAEKYSHKSYEKKLISWIDSHFH